MHEKNRFDSFEDHVNRITWEYILRDAPLQGFARRRNKPKTKGDIMPTETDQTFDTRVTLNNVVACFLSLNVEPTHFQGDPNSPKTWKATFLLDKNNSDHVKQFAVMGEVTKNVAKSQVPNLTEPIYKGLKKPWFDGSKMDPAKYTEQYRKAWVVRAYRQEKIQDRPNTPPYLCEGHDPDEQIPNEQAHVRFPDGCVVDASFDPYYDGGHGEKKMCFGLAAVQIIEKGVGFGGVSFVPTQHFKKHERKPLEGMREVSKEELKKDPW